MYASVTYYHTCILYIYYIYILIVDHCSICTFHGTSSSQTDVASFDNWSMLEVLCRRFGTGSGSRRSKHLQFPISPKQTLKNPKASSISVYQKKNWWPCVCSMHHVVFTTQNLDPTTTTSTRWQNNENNTSQPSDFMYTTWQGSMASHCRVLVYHGPDKLPPKLGVAPRLLKSHPPLHRKLTATLPLTNADKKRRSFSFPFLFKRSNPAFQLRKKALRSVPRESRFSLLKPLPDKTSWTIWCAVPKGHIPTSVIWQQEVGNQDLQRGAN